jgi:hypothetical protein
MKNKILCILSVIMLALLPCFSYAENADTPKYEAVSPLNKGDKAPFDGILFSKDLADRIEAEKKTDADVRTCEANSKAAIDICKSENQRKAEIAAGRYSAFQEFHNDMMKIKNGEIDFLRRNYLPTPWYKEPVFLVGSGIVVGAILVIGSAHVVKTVR